MEEKQERSFQDIIIGRNCVTEAFKSGRNIDSILIARGSTKGSLSVLLAKAKEKGIPIKEVDTKKLDFMCNHGSHQGVIAVCAYAEYSSIDDIFAKAAEKNEPPLIVILDEIEDPHNLGAIIRTAECAGAHGVIILKRHGAGLTFTVYKASAGALAYMPVVRVTNLASTIDELKKKGVWIYGADMGGEDYKKCDLKGAAAVVIGNEGKGIGRLIKEKCDIVLSLPLKGNINSLNASVAAGILLYEFAYQRTYSQLT
ncbi:MAG: 23S rRNA (guanosine(2251)-2'-O)-methyltransferase RlmB [Bacillota bacterium]|nr:23S rRNA (guanosine(2251)-2'-O)-methyltransferase RlmB [Bacillota bacterium]